MKRFVLTVGLAIALTLAGTACSKKEAPQTPPPTPPQGMPGQPPGMMGGGPEKTVVIPPNVKSAWKAVKIAVELKQAKSTKQYTIPLNSDFKVPETDLVLKVGDFLPHFAMTADQITSNSNNPENPAVRIEVLEAKKDVFKGWLFAKFPAVHPFTHDKYGLVLLEGIKK